MRELTQNECDLRDRRRQGFEAFFRESMPVLVDFMMRLELPELHSVLINAGLFVDPLDSWVRRQVVSTEDRVSTVARLGYFIGEWLIQQLKGCWFLNEIPDSRFFLRYVVGQFATVANTGAMTDPFLIADTYLAELPHANLRITLAEVASELNCA
jgi:hypothetical protein